MYFKIIIFISKYLNLYQKVVSKYDFLTNKKNYFEQ